MEKRLVKINQRALAENDDDLRVLLDVIDVAMFGLEEVRDRTVDGADAWSTAQRTISAVNALMKSERILGEGGK